MNMRYIFLIYILFTSCKNDVNRNMNCGVQSPANDLLWLKNVIAKADSDKVYKTYKGNYLGAIYLENLNGRDVFYSTMMMYSGGVYFHVYNCEGKLVSFDNNQETLNFINNLKKDKLIYSNEP